RWNADKRYLLEIEARGVRITPTRVIEQEAAVSLRSVLADAGWSHAVIKPTVSSTGYETWFVTVPCSAQDEQRFARQRARMPVLVQEFAGDVQHGEYSFVFIAGEYTHCILKRPAADEFRVHIEHGGTVESVLPEQKQIEWAGSVLATLGGQPWSYARVDAVGGSAGMMLMEFELLDPELFFLYNRAAAERFADQLLR
ncbi:MAG TPA: hypothetical protein VF021_02400, partial [Longimicrobiales bacterium]